MSATPTNMHALRERLASEFKDLLNTQTVLTDKEGNPILVDGKPLYKPHSPALYNVIRQFLKDNGIDRDPLPGSFEAQKSIVDGLPFREPDQLNGPPAHLLAEIEEGE